jgi:hypothetical protein
MFKFIKQYAEKINNAEVYPMISLIIFFLFFRSADMVCSKNGQNKSENIVGHSSRRCHKRTHQSTLKPSV